MPIQYVLFDRDGTLIHHVHHLANVSEVKIFEDVPKALIILGSKFRFGIVTNQSVVGRGLISLEGVDSINRRILDELGDSGVYFDFVMVCPHMPDSNCNCRKPNVGLGLRAIEEFNIDIKRSFVVGDQTTDMIFARNLGITGIGIRNPIDSFDTMDAHFENLLEAAKWIMDRKD